MAEVNVLHFDKFHKKESLLAFHRLLKCSITNKHSVTKLEVNGILCCVFYCVILFSSMRLTSANHSQPKHKVIRASLNSLSESPEFIVPILL